MELWAPVQYAAETWQRPPLHDHVQIIWANDPDTPWPLYLRLRLDASDLAVSPDFSRQQGGPATLVVRGAGQVERFPVELTPLAGPVAGWRVRYTGAPDREDLRQEQRFVEELVGWVMRGDAAPPAYPTRSYDISRRAARLFVPWRVQPDDILRVRWTLPAVVEGTMRVVRGEMTPVFWNGQTGYQTVGVWADLPEAMARLWHRYCWQQQDAAQ